MADTDRDYLTRSNAMDWEELRGPGGLSWHVKDLSGERIGARFEQLAPGAQSSFHHYHTVEEEHVLMVDGAVTLVSDDGEHTLTAGDHVWFPAGRTIAHHLENRGAAPCSYLVFGERTDNDVVVYPEHDVMLLKSLGRRQFRATELPPRGSNRDDAD